MIQLAGFAAAALLCGAVLLRALPAHADDRSQQEGGRRAAMGEQPQSSERFSDHERRIVYGYYDRDARAGRCPPGLAHKHNGCVPQGHAKKWQVGQRLPRGVVYHDLPRRLVIDLAPPPSRYRYIQVAQDILMIAVGTGMVMDAIVDVGVTRNQ